MKCVYKLKETLFGIPMVDGKISHTLGIIKGYIAGQIFVILFSPFRSVIVKESLDDERKFRYTNILDNILIIVLLGALLISLHFVKPRRKRTITIFSFKTVLCFIMMEVTLMFKPDHKRLISM